MPDEKQLWEEYDKWFYGKGISDYGTKMFGFMAAKWVHSFYAERIAELEQDRTRLAFARHRIDDFESRMAMAPAVEPVEIIDEAIERLEVLYAFPTVGDSAPEPVAWMHDADNRPDCISDDVKKVLLASTPKIAEHYTIPLYAHPPVQTADVRAMTDQQILDIADYYDMGTSELFTEFTEAGLLTFARALLEQKK